MRIAFFATAVLFVCAGASARADSVPQLIVNRAQPLQIWTSAADAPIYAGVGAERRIEFFDSRDGTLLHTVALAPAARVPESRSSPPPLIVSNDGAQAALGALNGIAIITTADARMRSVPTTLAGSLTPLAFTPGGKTLAVSVKPTPDPHTYQAGPTSIALVAVANGHAMTVPDGEMTAAISPDGGVLATLTPARDKLLLYDINSGAEHALTDGGGVYGPLVFSPDGKFVASGGDDPSIPPRGNGFFDAGATDHDLVVKVWDVRRGRLVGRFPWRPVYAHVGLDEQAVGEFCFADAHTVAINTAHEIVLYDTLSSAVTGRLTHGDTPATAHRVNGVLGMIAEHETNLTFTHWTGTSESTDATLPFNTRIGSIAIDPRSHLLAVADDVETHSGTIRNGVYGLDLTTLHWWGPIAQLAEQPTPHSLQPLFFLPDGRLAVTSQEALQYVDFRAGSVAIHAIPGAENAANGDPTFTISGDGQTVFSGMPTGLLSPANAVPETIPMRAYDVATGRLRYQVAGIRGVPLACAATNSQCASMVRTTDATELHHLDPVSVVIFDSATGKRISSLLFHNWLNIVGFFNSDAALVVSEPTYAEVETDLLDVVDPKRGVVVRRFKMTDSALSLAPAAPFYALTDAGGTTIYKLNGTVVSRIANAIAGKAGDVTFFPDGSKVAIRAGDGSIEVRDTASGRLLVSLAFFREQSKLDWLAYTPAGYYAGTPFATSTIRWHVDDRMYPSTAFARQFYRPDTVMAALR